MITPDQYLTQTDLKRELGLTDRLIRELDQPEHLNTSSLADKKVPIKRYNRNQVTQWITDHPDLIAQAQIRKAAARKAVETKRNNTTSYLRLMLKKVALRPTPPKEELRAYLCWKFERNYPEFNGLITERALCSHIRHAYTSYDQIMTHLYRKVGKGQIYMDVKVYLCCMVVRAYDLKVDPVFAAFGKDPTIDRYEWTGHGYGLEAYLRAKLGLNE